MPAGEASILIMKNKEAAEDVRQEAYMKAFSKLDKLSEPEALKDGLARLLPILPKMHW